jgi:hypothetical protein
MKMESFYSWDKKTGSTENNVGPNHDNGDYVFSERGNICKQVFCKPKESDRGILGRKREKRKAASIFPSTVSKPNL